MIGRKDDSVEISWEITQRFSVQTSSPLYQYKHKWGLLNTWCPKPEHRWPQLFNSLLMALSFEQIVAWLLFAANTEKKKRISQLSALYAYRKFVTSGTGQAMRICYAPGVLMRENAAPPLFLWIKLEKKNQKKKTQSSSIVVCFFLRGVIKTDCSGWFTGTQVKTIKI